MWKTSDFFWRSSDVPNINRFYLMVWDGEQNDIHRPRLKIDEVHGRWILRKSNLGDSEVLADVATKEEAMNIAEVMVKLGVNI